jgi:hypothetical protein
MVEDMNRAMAWNFAGVDRRTRDAAVEAARRAGMRLDDWLDEAIAEQAGLDPRAQGNEADDRLDAALGRLERIARRRQRKSRARPEFRALSIPWSSAWK